MSRALAFSPLATTIGEGFSEGGSGELVVAVGVNNADGPTSSFGGVSSMAGSGGKSKSERGGLRRFVPTPV